MRIQLNAILLTVVMILSGCSTGGSDMDEISPPVAAQRPKTLSIHSDTGLSRINHVFLPISKYLFQKGAPLIGRIQEDLSDS